MGRSVERIVLEGKVTFSLFLSLSLSCPLSLMDTRRLSSSHAYINVSVVSIFISFETTVKFYIGQVISRECRSRHSHHCSRYDYHFLCPSRNLEIDGTGGGRGIREDFSLIRDKSIRVVRQWIHMDSVPSFDATLLFLDPHVHPGG